MPLVGKNVQKLHVSGAWKSTEDIYKIESKQYKDKAVPTVGTNMQVLVVVFACNSQQHVIKYSEFHNFSSNALKRCCSHVHTTVSNRVSARAFYS